MINSFISSRNMQKTVALLAILCLAAIFVSSLWVRVQDPSITVETRVGPDQEDQAAMAEIAALMAEVERNPENVDALTELANFFMIVGSWERSLAFWVRVLALEPENRLALNQAGFALFQQQRYQDAVEYFEKLIELDEDNYRGHYNLGIIFKYYLDDQQSARDHFQSILQIGPEDKEVIERVQYELDNPLPDSDDQS